MGKKTQTRTSPVTSAAGNSPPTIPVADGPDPDMASQPSPQGRKHRSRGREKIAVSQQEQNTSTRPKAASTVVKEETGTSNGTHAAISTDRSAAGRSSRKRRKTGPEEQSQVDTDENNTAVGKQLSHKTRQKSSERAVRTEVQSSDAQGHSRGKKRKAPPGGAGRNDNKADKSVNGSSGSGPSQKKRRHNRGSSPASAQGRSLTEGASCFSASGAATSDVQKVAATSRSPCKSKENKKKGGARKEKESSLQTTPCKGNRTESKVTGKDGGAAGSSSSAKGRKRKKKKRQGSKPELGTEEARATRTETPAEPAEAEKCAICLEELTDQRVGTPSCCQHSYCLDCIQTWAQRKNKCPVDNKTFHEIVARERLGGAITNRIPAPDRNEVHPEDDDDLFTINIDGEEVNILEQLNGYFLRYQEGWDHWDDDDDDESGWVSVDEDGDDSDDDDEDDSDEDSYSDDSSDEDRDNSEGGSYSASGEDWTFFDDNYDDSDGSDRGGSSDEADSDSDSHDSSGEDDDETLYSGYDDDYGPATDYNDGSPYSNQDGSSEEASSYDEYYENGDDHNNGYNNEYGDDGYDAYSNGYYDHGYNNYDDYEGNYYDGYDHGYNDQSNNEDYYDDGYDCGYGNNYSDRSDQDSDESSDTGSSDW